MGKVVYGIIQDLESLDRTVEELESQGFCFDDISIVMPEQLNQHPLIHAKRSMVPEDAGQSRAAGAGTGGILGLLLGLGTLRLPGLQPLSAGGPVLSMLGAAAAGGAAGGIASGLVGLGIPETEARKHAKWVDAGNILIAIHAPDRDWARHARWILDQHAVANVASSEEANDGN